MKLGSPQHVRLAGCAAQANKLQGAAFWRAPEAANPEAGWRWRATQQIVYLRKQHAALHVKGYLKLDKPKNPPSEGLYD